MQVTKLLIDHTVVRNAALRRIAICPVAERSYRFTAYDFYLHTSFESKDCDRCRRNCTYVHTYARDTVNIQAEYVTFYVARP